MFDRLNLSVPILQALKGKGYQQPTPVQQQAIPLILSGRDLFCSARTGTGKTAAFALPLLELMSQTPSVQRKVRTLILAPTRELAIQIHESFHTYGKNLNLRYCLIYGGVSQQKQASQLRKGVDVIIATPGRLLDLMDQKLVSLQGVEYFVLDEADRMLDMGFIPDIKRIVFKLPAKRQTLMFSATLPSSIKKLAADLLQNPATLEVRTESNDTSKVRQMVYFVRREEKTGLLYQLIKKESIDRALIFTRTRRSADKLVKALNQKGIRSQAIHGDKSQSQRERALTDFKNRKLHMLIATDVASRGIDVKDLSHVINFDMPEVSETYTHRIGRTGRAGADGSALSFCSPDEKWCLREIQKFSGQKIPVGLLKEVG